MWSCREAPLLRDSAGNLPGTQGNAALGAAGRPEVTGLWAECCGHCGHQVGCDGSPGGALAAQPCSAPRCLTRPLYLGTPSVPLRWTSYLACLLQ